MTRSGVASLAALGELSGRADEDACLDYLRDLRYPDGTPCPRCGQPTRFHRVRGRSAYACQYCRHQVYPTAETIFRRSTTPLRCWFGAIVLANSRRGAATVAELERAFGVNRKTAARMLSLILPLVHGGDEAMLTVRTPPRPSPSPTEGRPASPPLSRDRLREELLESIAGLREELQAAELRARAAASEVGALHDAIANLEKLIGTGPAR